MGSRVRLKGGRLYDEFLYEVNCADCDWFGRIDGRDRTRLTRRQAIQECRRGLAEHRERVHGG